MSLSAISVEENRKFAPDTLDVDHAYDERGMGTEIQYIFYGETECQCSGSSLQNHGC